MDIPLNAEGRAQAQALARALRDERFDYAASSDLSRAYDTAVAIRGSASVERDPRWREFAFGEWEGRTWDEIVARHPELAESSGTSAERYAPPGGESFDSVRSRVEQALAEYEARGYGDVLVVTHAGPLHAMLHVFFGESPVRFAPAGITRVEVREGRAELVVVNDISHVIQAEWE